MSHQEADGHEQVELFEMRPRFKLHSPLTAEEVKQLVGEALENEPHVHGWLTKYHAHVHIPKHLQHYWSPVLHAGIEDDEYEGGCLIRVLIGPKQSIWVMFTFLKGAIGMLGLFGGLYGISEWQLGKSAMFLWTVPIAIVLALGVFAAAKAGQDKGYDEMEHLIRFMAKALKKAEVKRLD